MELLRRYRNALNYAIRAVIARKALSLGRAHALLYRALREAYGLPPRVAQGCYREAIAIAKSWLKTQTEGGFQLPKRLGCG
ncbi:MAG: hypothetical protein LM577_08740 [Thermoproteaceae archaeon]|nr:hypothetical protein [Thermoproteaceae archaeon]